MALTKITADVIDTGTITADNLNATLDLSSKTLTLPSTQTATTQSAGDNSTKVATTAYVETATAALVDSAPGTLNTLNELAAALGDDANFSTTVTNNIALKAPLASPDFTGDVTFDTTTLVVDATNNRVGIGMNNPGHPLNVVDSGELQAEFSGYSHASAANNSRAGSGSIRLGSGVGTTGLLIDYTDQGQTVGLIKNEYVASSSSELRLQSPFLSFYTGTSASEAMRIDSSGSVLIGTTSSSDSSVKLEAHDATNPIIQVKDTTSNIICGIQAGNSEAVIRCPQDSPLVFNVGASETERMRITADGTMGFGMSPLGTNNGSAFFDGNVSSKDGFMTTASDLQLIQPSAGNSIFVRDNGNESMRIDSSGNVGIGISTIEQLGSDSVYPRIQSYSSATSGHFCGLMIGRPNSPGLESSIAFTVGGIMVGKIQHDYVASNHNDMSFHLRGASGSIDLEVMRLWAGSGSDTALLVGRTTRSWANADFEVDSNARIGNIYFTGSGSDSTIAAGNGNFKFSTLTATGGGTGLDFDVNIVVSGVGIANRFKVDSPTGDTYTNDGTISSLSDIRVKTDINDLTDGLEIVKQLRPVTFKYNDDSTDDDGNGMLAAADDKIRYGFIAQEVEEVAPHYVETSTRKINNEEVDDFKSLSTTRMIPMLFKAIQEQQTIIEDLQARIAELEG